MHMKQTNKTMISDELEEYGIERSLIAALYSANLETLRSYSNISAQHTNFIQRFLSMIMVLEVRIDQHPGKRTEWRQIRMKIKVDLELERSKSIISGLIRSWG